MMVVTHEMGFARKCAPRIFMDRPQDRRDAKKESSSARRARSARSCSSPRSCTTEKSGSEPDFLGSLDLLQHSSSAIR